MQFWLTLVSVASVAALNGGARVQPRTSFTKRAVVVPLRRGGKPAPEPEPELDIKQFAIDAGVTTLRLGTCALMVHHDFDKIQVPLSHQLIDRVRITR